MIEKIAKATVEDFDYVRHVVVTVKTPPFGYTARAFSSRARVSKIFEWARKQNPEAKEVLLTRIEEGGPSFFKAIFPFEEAQL